MVETTNEYDIIFAGGGTTACVVAGRLAAADRSLRILILEAGPHTKNDPRCVEPSRCIEHLADGDPFMSFHVAQPSPSLGDRQLLVNSGRCVGGGSMINNMMYTRAAASDYDDWETEYNNPGWGSKDLIPLLRKSETYQIKEHESQTHGHSGPLKVSYGGRFTNVGQQALDVAAKYDPGRKIAVDSNDLTTCDAYSRWQKWIDGKSGLRSDSAHHFIYNQEENKNLHVLAEKAVIRILIQDGRASGVEYTNDLTLNPTAGRTVHVANATRLVVVSAGAFGSPAILERSGIGSNAILSRLKIPQIVNLTGVGENYLDHPVAFVASFASEEAETMDGLYRDDVKEVDEQMRLWKHDGTGLVSHNAYDAALKLRPNADELKELGPEFSGRWPFFERNPDKAIALLAACSGFIGLHHDLPDRKYIGACYFLCHPESVGSVHINSASKPHEPSIFQADFLNTPSDVAILRLAYKKTRDWIRRIPLYRGELQPKHPIFPAGSAAECKEAHQPVPIDAPEIVYTAEDDKAIDDFHRLTVTSARHSLGTCAMKPREQGGVVDSQLNVYGVRGLKVADLSIAPSNVASNTYSSALVIGEKAAIIIAEELGIQNV
ncbi:GMC oxidoreductase-domain-containing protein [Chiua virens]|nr:GMC oxidoreductase-domain-containing protein [Chiua virens]